MFVHKDALFKIYFGDAQDKISKENLVKLAKEKEILELENFANLKKIIKLNNLVFLNQVHGQDGLVLDSLGAARGVESFVPDSNFLVTASSIQNFTLDGDFLVTNIAGVGIGVLTADCLPIVFVDTVKNVVSVVHAGWRGSVGEIATKACGRMQNNFNSNLSDIKVFFGPCIKSCCYRVAHNFVENLENFKFVGMSSCLEQKQDGLYFSLVKFNMLLLQEFGIAKENISLEYNLCTCCDKNFYSYRRGDIDGRQMTVVCLE